MKRPRRQRKADRLLHSEARAEEIRCDYAVAPFDRAATEMDEKWGIDRLPELVSPETAERYGDSLAKLNAAIKANDPQQAAAWASDCIKGLAYLDAEATRLGKQPASREVWEVELDGVKIGLMRDLHGWQAIKAARPDLKLVSLREAAMAVTAYDLTGEIMEATRQAFPQAEAVSITNKPLNDPIPF